MDGSAMIPYLSAREMARISGYTVGVIVAAVSRGEMPALRGGRGGHEIRVRRDEFEKWLASNTVVGGKPGDAVNREEGER